MPMDVTFTTKFNAARYARAVKRAVLFSFRGLVVLYWCLMAAWLVFMFAWWLKGWPEEGRSLAWSIPFFCGCAWVSLRALVPIYVRYMQRMLGDVPVTCRITDKGYETVCGDLVQKLPWQKFASHYHFVDDNTVSLMLKRAAPVMVLSELREHGIDRNELEAVFRSAGLVPAEKSMKRKAMIILSAMLGAVAVLWSLSIAFSAVESCRNGMRFDDTQSRLFEIIHGRDDPRRPIPLDDTRAKVVRALTDVGSPDEFIYVFEPEEEHDKVGLLARYGDWSCEAYYPCGCACAHYNGYWESLKTNHTSSVYLESDKAKWLEKIRPLAKELYEEEAETMCDDDKTIDTRRSSTCNGG